VIIRLGTPRVHSRSRPSTDVVLEVMSLCPNCPSDSFKQMSSRKRGRPSASEGPGAGRRRSESGGARKRFNIGTKYYAVVEAERLERLGVRTGIAARVAEHENVRADSSTVRNWLRQGNREKMKKAFYGNMSNERSRVSGSLRLPGVPRQCWEEVEGLLLRDLDEMWAQKQPIDYRAIQLAAFSAAKRVCVLRSVEFSGEVAAAGGGPFITTSQVQRFLQRNRRRSFILHGEAGGVSEEDVRPAMSLVRLVVQAESLWLYNADETGLYWRLMPRRTILPVDQGSNARGVPSMKPSDGDRVTLMVAGDSTGVHKVPMLMVGKAKRPRAFDAAFGRNVSPPVMYRDSSTAFMSGNIAKEWLTDAFLPHVAARRREESIRSRHPVVLIWDNCKAHLSVDDPWLQDFCEQNQVIILYLPARSTALYQPCDMGIIASLKSRYKRHLIEETVSAVLDSKEGRPRRAPDHFKRGHAGILHGARANLADVVGWVKSAWRDISSSVLSNCWKKATLFSKDFDASVHSAFLDYVTTGVANGMLSELLNKSVVNAELLRDCITPEMVPARVPVPAASGPGDSRDTSPDAVTNEAGEDLSEAITALKHDIRELSLAVQQLPAAGGHIGGPAQDVAHTETLDEDETLRYVQCEDEPQTLQRDKDDARDLLAARLRNTEERNDSGSPGRSETDHEPAHDVEATNMTSDSESEVEVVESDGDPISLLDVQRMTAPVREAIARLHGEGDILNQFDDVKTAMENKVREQRRRETRQRNRAQPTIRQMWSAVTRAAGAATAPSPP